MQQNDQLHISTFKIQKESPETKRKPAKSLNFRHAPNCVISTLCPNCESLLQFYVAVLLLLPKKSKIQFNQCGHENV